MLVNFFHQDYFLSNTRSILFIFPAKKLRKIRMHQGFFETVSNIRLKWRNFPAKKLRKNTGAQNTHAPIFFSYNINKGYFQVVYLFFNKSR